MRRIPVLAFLVLAGCAADTLDDVTYRRLVDRFDTYDQCLAEGDFAPCYQTLTFCADGRANANLDTRQEGPYRVRDAHAFAQLQTVDIVFDLENAMSAQLPGRHRWELVDPISIDCAR
jgi:hypothetical protein